MTPTLNQDTALKLAKGVISTLDQKPLRPYIKTMMTEGYKDALAFSAVSGDKADDFELFLSMCMTSVVLEKKQAHDLAISHVRAKRQNAA